MSDNLVRLTSPQFLLLGLLVAGEQAGRVLRVRITEFGLRLSAPAFYQMMARLEREVWVRGWYRPLTVRDQAVRERWYEITPGGRKQWKRACEFYRQVEVSSTRERFSDA